MADAVAGAAIRVSERECFRCGAGSYNLFLDQQAAETVEGAAACKLTKA